MKRFIAIIILTVATLVVGCTTIPPTNENDATDQYSTAASGGEPVDTASPGSLEAGSQEALRTYLDENVGFIKSLAAFDQLYTHLPDYDAAAQPAVHQYIYDTATQLGNPFDKLDLQGSAQSLEEMLKAEAGVTANVSFKVQPVDGVLLTVLMHTMRDNPDALSNLSAACTMQDEITEADDGFQVDITLEFPAEADIIETMCRGNMDWYMNTRFLYAYMKTLYGAEGELADAAGNTDPLPTGWIFPVASHTRFTDTWLADRSGGTRKHTGTDIIANENVEIYSCTDAEVLFVGFSEGTGNFIWTRDGYGYEFIYCHMVKQTDSISMGDSVEAGQLIGHVGNTGNSDTNHLHLSVIAPSNDYVNPFTGLSSQGD